MSDELTKSELQGLFDNAMSVAAGNDLQEQIANGAPRYERIGEFGSGGRKRVIHARDRFTGREIALAVLKPPSTDDDTERFLREARMVAQLQHPAIIPVYDVGISDEHGPYFVMKPAETETFETIVKALRGTRGDAATKWPLALRLDLFSRVCQGIAYAHSRGILHLDLKPSNILLGRFGEALVSDWGIGRQLDAPEEDDFVEDEEMETSRVKLITQHGVVKGTPGYMAPEQMLAQNTTVATDVYGLGGILYALLTSLPPVSGGSYGEIEHATVQGSIVRPSVKRRDLEIPGPLDAIVMKALSRKPESRYKSVAALLEDFEKFRSGYVPAAYDAGAIDHLRLAYSRNRRIVQGLASAAFVLVAITAIFVLQLSKEQKTARAAEKVAVASLQKEADQNARNQELLDALQEAQETKHFRSNALAIRVTEDAEKAFKEKAYKHALDLLNSAVALSPDFAKARKLRGDLNVAAMNLPQAAEDYRHASNDATNNLADVVQRSLALPTASPEDRSRVFQSIVISLAYQRRQDLIEASIDLAPLSELPPKVNIEARLRAIKIANPKQKKWTAQVRQEGDHFVLDLSNHEYLTDIEALRNAPINSLDLSRTNVPTTAIGILRTTPLHALSYRHLSSAYSKELALPNLKIGNFAHSKLKWVNAFAECPLEELDVSHSSVEDFSSLKNCPSLKRLTVSANQKKKATALAPKVSVIVVN